MLHFSVRKGQLQLILKVKSESTRTEIRKHIEEKSILHDVTVHQSVFLEY
jgi:hypothetical protein